MTQLKSVIVEDEKNSRESLKNIIEEFIDGVEVVGMAASVEEGISVIEEVQPDLVFLDIELQTATGFDLLDRIENRNFEVIFTTAFEQYALKAIKISSLDYLLKPIDIDELQLAVNKYKHKPKEGDMEKKVQLLLNQINNDDTPNKICLSTSDGFEFVDTENIVLCEANGSYTNFILKEGKQILVSKNLKEYENLLAGNRFMRVHNSFLINLKEVKKYVKSDGGYIIMNNAKEISISPRRKDEFMQKMSAL